MVSLHATTGDVIMAMNRVQFQPGLESSYEKVDTHWLGALGFKLDGRTIAERRV